MKVRISLVALCLLIFHCSAAYGQTPKKDDWPAEGEYKQVNYPSDEYLNHSAKDGWEVVAAAGGANDTVSFYWVILKRSKSHPLFGTQTQEFLLPARLIPYQKSKCKLTLAQAPVIRALRLGMHGDELFAILSSNVREEFDRAQQFINAHLHP